MDNAEIIIFVLAFTTFLLIFWHLNKKFTKHEINQRVMSARNITTHSTSSRVKGESIDQKYEAGVSDVFDMKTSQDRSEYKVMFEQAGWSTKDAPQTVALIKAILAIGLSLTMLLFVNIFHALIVQPFLMKVLLVISAGAFGILMFGRVMNYIINRRYDIISNDLHSAVELLVVCSKAGMGIERGMERVAQEVAQYNPELAKEFYLTSVELELMPNRKLAYENLRRRVNLPLIYGMITTLIQAEEQGSSVSDSLRVLSEEFRTQVLMNFERKAAKLPATLSVPVVIFTLPTLMAVIMGPAIIQLMKETSIF